MDGSIRVIKGPDTGVSCKLKPGANIIGRSSKAALTLTSPDISWEHFAIHRNGDQYTVENLSAMGTYLDDSKITGQIKLRSRDQLRLSKDTVIRFDSGGTLDGGLFAGGRGIAVLVSIAVALIAAVVFMVINSRTTPANWPGAYVQLQAWVQQQVTPDNPKLMPLDKRLPPQTLHLFQDAWALEQAGDYNGANKAWLKLRLLLEHLNDAQKLPADAEDHTTALRNLLIPPPGPPQDQSDPEMAAALKQFVSRRLAWCTEQVKNSK